ncbi:hypothetical protein BJX66DRAFT_217189 [Aspergillus keveii]|uniref:Uncharacterized protein n=1 Tax=Aspergillus keveii TaxID=714993 RepID=A0ABR4G4H2_9EURO
MANELGTLEYGPNNVGGCCFHTKTLLFHCVREEQHFAAQNLRPCSPIFSRKTYLDTEVSHKGMRKILTADADCSVRYTEHETAPCLVLLEARAPDSLSMCLVECLTHMSSDSLCDEETPKRSEYCYIRCRFG